MVERAHSRTAPTAGDLDLLDAVVALTPRRVNVPARRAFERLHGRPPGRGDLVDLRMAVLRLERDGLVRSDPQLNLEPTPDGEVAVGLHRVGRARAPEPPGRRAG